MTRLSTRETTFVLLIALAALLLRLGLMLRPEALLYSRPYFDDTFYALGCAYHLAAGHGLTSDGIHPTNGIQPLIVLLDVPLFAIASADKLLGLRLTILLQALIDTISVWLVALLVGRLRTRADTLPAWRSPPVIAAIFWAFLFNMIRQTMNGLETGLFSLLILLVLLNYSKRRNEADLRISKWAGLGALLGILVLARIDGVFIICGIIAVELYRKKLQGIKPLFFMGVTSILVSSPWWIFNFIRFGSVMPMSGQSEALGINFGANIFDGAVAIADILSNFFFFPYQEFPIWSRWVYAIALPILIVVVVRRFQLVNAVRSRYNLSGLAPLAISGIGFLIFYLFFFAAWWFLYRYFQPIRILWTMLSAIGLSIVIEQIQTFVGARRIAYRAVLVLILAAAVVWNADRYLENYREHNIFAGYLVGKWAQQHPDALIGMEQAGTSRFLAPNIVNLDGKVNPETLAARRSGQIGKYVAEHRFDYIIDWGIIAVPIVEKAKRAGANYSLDGKIGTMDVYMRTP